MRYNYLPIQKIGNTPRLSTMYIDIPTEKFESKVVKYNFERLDALADNFYGDGTLWEIIAMFNGIKNPLKINLQYLLIPTDIRAVIDYIEQETKG